MSLFTSPGKMILASGSAAALLPVVEGLPVVHEMASAVTPYADTAFGLALPVAAFTAAVAGEAVMRAVRRFRAAPTIETTGPKPYEKGTWKNVRGEQLAGQSGSVTAQPEPAEGQKPNPPAAKPLQNGANIKVNDDLRITVETIEDPDTLLNAMMKWVEEQRNISDVDFYYIMSKMPRGRTLGWDRNGLRELHERMADKGLSNWGNNTREVVDMFVVYAMIRRINMFCHPHEVSAIRKEVEAFLPTSRSWTGKKEEYRAELARYFHHECERLEKMAENWTGA